MSDANTLDGEDLPIYSPVCELCVHLVNGDERRCRAFPDGIPKEIWTGENPHKTPYPGDGGIIFQSKFEIPE